MNLNEPLFAAIHEYIKEARECLESGDTERLSQLDMKVANLKTDAAELSAEEQIGYMGELNYLADELMKLHEALKAAKTDVANAMQATFSQRKAHVAYQVMDARDKKDEEE